MDVYLLRRILNFVCFQYFFQRKSSQNQPHNHVSQHHVDQIRNASWLVGIQLVHASKGLSIHHQTVAQSAY